MFRLSLQNFDVLNKYFRPWEIVNVFETILTYYCSIPKKISYWHETNFAVFETSWSVLTQKCKNNTWFGEYDGYSRYRSGIPPWKCKVTQNHTQFDWNRFVLGNWIVRDHRNRTLKPMDRHGRSPNRSGLISESPVQDWFGARINRDSDIARGSKLVGIVPDDQHWSSACPTTVLERFWDRKMPHHTI